MRRIALLANWPQSGVVHTSHKQPSHRRYIWRCTRQGRTSFLRCAQSPAQQPQLPRTAPGGLAGRLVLLVLLVRDHPWAPDFGHMQSNLKPE
jgi:hypothetical protein